MSAYDTFLIFTVIFLFLLLTLALLGLGLTLALAILKRGLLDAIEVFTTAQQAGIGGDFISIIWRMWR